MDRNPSVVVCHDGRDALSPSAELSEQSPAICRRDFAGRQGLCSYGADIRFDDKGNQPLFGKEPCTLIARSGMRDPNCREDGLDLLVQRRPNDRIEAAATGFGLPSSDLRCRGLSAATRGPLDDARRLGSCWG
jgi:hypothetical protein